MTTFLYLLLYGFTDASGSGFGDTFYQAQGSSLGLASGKETQKTTAKIGINMKNW